MARPTKQQQQWALDDLEERESLRATAQTVDCPPPPFGCEQPAGQPCRNRVGEPLKKIDHPHRRNRAIAESAECPPPPTGCGRPAGQQCTTALGAPLGHKGYHASRFARAQATEDRPHA